MNRIFGLNKNIFVLGLTSFFNDLSNEMIHSAMPTFFISVLKTGAASLGIVEGIADGIANFLKIYSGHLSDRLSKRKLFIYIGYGMAVAIRPLYMFVGSVSGVLGLRVIDRVGKGVREAPRDVIISVSATNGDTGRSFGYHRAMDAAGGILGPLLAFVLLTRFEGQWGIFFMTAFVIGLVAVGTIFFVKEVVVARDPNGTKLFSWNVISTFPVSFRMYLLSVFILSVGSLPTAVVLLKTASIGVAIASIPLFYMVYSLSFTLFSYSAGRLSDRIGTGRVLFLGYIFLIIAYAGMVWAQSVFALAVFYAVMGLYSACTDSTQRSYVALSTAEYQRGTAYGLYNAVVGFGAMIAGIVGGLIWQTYGATYALFIAGSMVTLGLVIFWFAKRGIRHSM